MAGAGAQAAAEGSRMKNRMQFAYRVDLWDADGENVRVHCGRGGPSGGHGDISRRVSAPAGGINHVATRCTCH
jgi:hypothetical protein